MRPDPSTIDIDTITVGQALPWFVGAIKILVGCTIAGMLWYFGLSWNDPVPAKPSLDYQI